VEGEVKLMAKDKRQEIALETEALDLAIKKKQFKSVDVFNRHLDEIGECIRQSILNNYEREMIAPIRNLFCELLGRQNAQRWWTK
jgi:hypothetical protein